MIRKVPPQLCSSGKAYSCVHSRKRLVEIGNLFSRCWNWQSQIYCFQCFFSVLCKYQRRLELWKLYKVCVLFSVWRKFGYSFLRMIHWCMLCIFCVLVFSCECVYFNEMYLTILVQKSKGWGINAMLSLCVCFFKDYYFLQCWGLFNRMDFAISLVLHNL